MVVQVLHVLLGLLVILTIAGNSSAKSTYHRADVWTGYLIDLSCALERKDLEPDLGPRHSRKCLLMPACDRSGFGLLTSDREVLRFDEDGNRKARELAMKTKQEANLRVVVRGVKSGDLLEVRRIYLR